MVSDVKKNGKMESNQRLGRAYLLLVDGDPVGRLKPAVVLDVVDAALQVAETLRQIDLQQVAQQILQVRAEVRRKFHLVRAT